MKRKHEDYIAMQLNNGTWALEMWDGDEFRNQREAEGGRYCYGSQVLIVF